MCDHKNGDPLDCRRENLRILPSNAENLQNRGGGYGISAHRGVTWSRYHERWVAQAKIGIKHHHLGYFESEEEAARVAATFRREHMPYSNE